MCILVRLRPCKYGPVEQQIDEEPEYKKERVSTKSGIRCAEKWAGMATHLPEPNEMSRCDQQGCENMQHQSGQYCILVSAQATYEIANDVVIADPG